MSDDKPKECVVIGQVLGQFLGLFVTAMILSTGGHLVMLSTLNISLDVLPVGGPVRMQAGMLAVVQLGGTLLSLARLRTMGVRISRLAPPTESIFSSTMETEISALETLRRRSSH